MIPLGESLGACAAVAAFAAAYGLGVRRGRTRPIAVSAARDEHPVDRRFELLLRNLPLAALTLSRRGMITSINPTAAALFGLDPHRVLGRALIEAIPSIELERQVSAALRGESSMRTIVIAEVAQERTFSVAAFTLDDRGDVALIASDQTQLVALERVRREFVSNVSHELRTPLSSIKLMVETVLLSDGDSDAAPMFLPKVVREVDRMVALVDDLLQVAHSESGRLALRRESFDLADFAASILNMFAHRAETLEVALDLETREPVRVWADRNRLTQVLVNLLDNALRHTPSGGSVTVAVERDAGEAIVSVRDTGVGIPYADLPHIFERFYVVDRSRSREHTGTGLGLSIARHLVEAHGGTLIAHSVLGDGATFECRLPVVSEPAKIKVS